MYQLKFYTFYLCAADVDYETQNYNTIFYPGETRQTLLLDLIDDDTVEDTEYYYLNISKSLPNHVSVGTYAETKITIQDDDGELWIFIIACLHFSIHQRSIRC